jgi:hypothetical protein
MNEITVTCPEAYAALKDAVSVGLRIVREHEAKGSYISLHFDFPEIDYFESGLPRFSKTTWGSDKGPKDYVSVFRDHRKAESIAEWQPFFELAHSDERLRRYFDETAMYRQDVLGSAEVQEMIDRRLTFSIGYTIEKLVDRYVHTAKSTEFDESRFLPIYREWEAAVFEEKVVFDILVPILMVMCDFHALDIANGLAIERMEQGVQLARSRHSRFPISANECVVGAATHALVLRHWTIENGPRFSRSSSLTNVENFHHVVAIVDRLFAALRAVSGVQTGYSQLLIRPDGWGDSWLAHLPQVDAMALRAYPDHFENYLWLQQPPVLNRDSCMAAGRLYEAIVRLKKNQMMVAARRLNHAFLRSSEQDSIIDVAIGLETLLVPDGGQGEITHKLAMRLGAICRMQKFENHEPSEVFEICKRIYAFRSSVAHGSKDVSKKRTITIRASKDPVEAISLGIALLRHVIMFLADRPEYLDTKKLDMTLFPSDPPTSSSV